MIKCGYRPNKQQNRNNDTTNYIVAIYHYALKTAYKNGQKLNFNIKDLALLLNIKPYISYKLCL